MSKGIINKLAEDRQYRDIDPGQIEHRIDQDSGEKIVEGYATVFNQRYPLWIEPGFEVYEEIDPNAFDETDMSDVIMQYDHEGRVFARMSNNTLIVHPDDFGLHITARLDGTELGRQLYEEIDGGYTNKMSFGFTVAEDERVENIDRETGMITILRRIKKIKKLYDVSAVSLPANDATSISARSYGEGVIAEIREELAERAKRERQKQKIRILTEVNKK